MAITTVPRPGSSFGLSDERPAVKKTNINNPEMQDVDPVVRWANAKKAQLEDEASTLRERQKRNRDYYKGRQTFDFRNRPKWMNAIVDNDSFFVVERWTALLTDNKPKVVFSAYQKQDQLEADVAN